MLKVVVFDNGWGGELVANYLEQELNIIEVIRVIDWTRERYQVESAQELADQIAKSLGNYIGSADVIVLGGYVVSRAQRELSKCYPTQKFVGMRANLHQSLASRNLSEQTVVLMNNLIDTPELRLELQHELPYTALIIPDCSGWEELIDQDLMTAETLRSELAWDFALKPRKKSRRLKMESETRQSLAEACGLAYCQNEKQVIFAAVQKFGRAAKEVAQAEAVAVMESSPESAAGELRPDTILLLDTHFWAIKQELEEVFGWQVRILDFRHALLHDVCAALGLRGVDGYRHLKG